MTKEESLKNFVVHMIGNAHIDPIWLWRWQEGYQAICATFRNMLKLMDEFPAFIFTCSSAAFYEWVEKGDPDLFNEIRMRVREGRWVPIGGWWVEPDCNIPDGESFFVKLFMGRDISRRSLDLQSRPDIISIHLDIMGCFRKSLGNAA